MAKRCHCGKKGRPLGSMSCPVHGYVVVPKAAFDWLIGAGEDFEKPVGAVGNYWWRSEFRRRAGL